jgi:hypothetical protein
VAQLKIDQPAVQNEWISLMNQSLLSEFVIALASLRKSVNSFTKKVARDEGIITRHQTKQDTEGAIN